MPRSVPRRRADPPVRTRQRGVSRPKPLEGTRQRTRADGVSRPKPPERPRQGGASRSKPPGRTRRLPTPSGRTKVAIASVVLLLATAGLVAAMVPVGPSWLAGLCSVAVAATYAWALAARTGGRPLVSGVLAAVLGLVVLVWDEDALRTGAAVMTCVVSAVLAVTATVPARRFVHAVRECAFALLVAAVGAMATVGFEPTITVVRFEYVTLALALVGAFLVVHRLGAGLHGLGRRGIAIVLIGTVVLAVTLAYAELLRHYGTPGLVTSLLDVVRWSRDHLGAFPRPIETVLGIPALAWGCHMRARRRQGWWVCAFGVCATASVANSLANPATSLLECTLSVVYGAVVGLLIGYLVIRADLALTGPRGRRSRRAEEAAAGRPEPRRTEALL